MVASRDGRAFIGREPELAVLDHALAATRGGGGRAVVVAGEAGIGKSRLLRRFGDVARADGARVLSGACVAGADGGIPYGPFIEVLREIVRDTPDALLPAILGPARRELSRLLPELAARQADLPAASELDRTARARLLELVVGVFERLAAARALALVIEDLQWADEGTIDLLGLLVRALDSVPLLLLMSLRTDVAATPAVLDVVAEIEREEAVGRLDLRPFGRDEVAAQLRSLAGRDPDQVEVASLLARSDGNPFYVEELTVAGGVGDAIPPVLRDVTAARIARLSPRAREVLRAAAIAGRRVDDGLLDATLGLARADLAAGLREALAAGILSRDPDGRTGELAFRHALLHEAVTDELLPTERTALHAAFAAALESRVAGLDAATVDPEVAGEIARHWDAGGRPDRALPGLVAAARGAERSYAFETAFRRWSRAADLALDPVAAATIGLGREAILEAAADAAVLAGEFAAAVELGRAAVALVDPRVRPADAGRLRDRLRWYLWEAGDRPAAEAAVRAAIELLPSDVPSVSRARALAQLAGILLYAGEYGLAVERAREAVAVARAADAPGEEALALGIMGWCQAVLGDPAAGIARFAEGQAIAERLGAVEGIALALVNRASLLDRIGRTAESLDAATSGYAILERLGLTRTYGGMLLGFRAKADYLLGRWDEAEAETDLGLRRGPTGRAELWLAVNRARVLAGRGRFEETAALVDRARDIEARLGGTEFAGPVLVAAAELALGEHRVAGVRQAASEGLRLADRPGPPDPSLAWLAAAFLRAVADARDARGGTVGPDDALLAERIRAASESAASTLAELQSGSRRGEAILGQLRAEHGRLTGTDDAGDWQAVAAEWTRAGRPYAAAYAELRLGAALLATRGDRADASAALRRAADGARGLGAEPLLAEVEALAAHARITVPDLASPNATDRTARRGSSGVGSSPLGGPSTDPALTPREAEVLRLLAGGWSNQQIADALFITRKTASVHVSNIMAKLGVDGRTAAAALAHRLGVQAAEVPGATRES